MTESEPSMDPLRWLVITRLQELGTKDHPMSPRAAAERANGAISHSTLYNIAQGRHTGRITDKVARGLAAALDMPIERVYEAAGASQPQTRWTLPEKFDRVALEHRGMFEDLVAAFLEAERRGFERGRRGGD